MPGLAEIRETTLETPFGAPSDAYVLGTLEGRKVAFLARHGRGHRILPSELNFRANIHGFKQLGVERILSVSAVDQRFFSRHLSQTLSLGIEPPPGYREIVEQVTRKTGIHGKMPELMIERRLQPYMGELHEWTFQRFAQQCKQHGIHALVVYRPEPL